MAADRPAPEPTLAQDSAGRPQPVETPGASRQGRIRAMRARAVTARARAEAMRQQMEDRRDRVRTVDIAFTAYEHDRDAGGSLLAGAIAYRMFLWILPVALVLVGGLGFLSSENPQDPNRAVRDAGIASIPVSSIDQAAKNSSRAWWLVVVFGLVLLYMASVALVKALWAAHALVWRTPATRIPSKPRLAGEFLLACLAIAAASSLASVIRNSTSTGGLIVMIADLLVYVAAWWALSTRFPHRDAPWTALIPGAVLFGVGVQVLHLVSVYYLAGRLTRASVLYGTLGVAAALLLGFYLIGRLMILSAQFNEAIWIGRHGPPRQEESYDKPIRASTSSTGATTPAKKGPNSA
jgi:uncharacterized BrkB/YihY/UPF0761 family membrane protein